MFFHFLSISSLVLYFDFFSLLWLSFLFDDRPTMCIVLRDREMSRRRRVTSNVIPKEKRSVDSEIQTFNYLLFFVWIFLSHLLASVSLSIINVIERQKSRISFVWNSTDLARKSFLKKYLIRMSLIQIYVSEILFGTRDSPKRDLITKILVQRSKYTISYVIWRVNDRR